VKTVSAPHGRTYRYLDSSLSDHPPLGLQAGELVKIVKVEPECWIGYSIRQVLGCKLCQSRPRCNQAHHQHDRRGSEQPRYHLAFAQCSYGQGVDHGMGELYDLHLLRRTPYAEHVCPDAPPETSPHLLSIQEGEGIVYLPRDGNWVIGWKSSNLNVAGRE
jgi:hypothetical protein